MGQKIGFPFIVLRTQPNQNLDREEHVYGTHHHFRFWRFWAESGTVRLSQRTRCKSLVEVSGRTGSHSARWRAQAKIAGRSAKLAAPYLHTPMVIVNTGKGLEAGTHYTMSQILQEELPHLPIVTITGPSHAEEVARNVPTTVVAASKDLQAAEYVQKTMSSETLRLYRNSDIIGCEVGGALKNIIALSAGICDGLGCGDNTKAALMTRGMHEITKLGVAMGGQRETFAGLSGIGDLIVTCCSMHSRNRRAGILIGEGVSPEEAVQQVGTVEGYHCCEVAYALAQQMGVSMPITEQLNQVLFHGGNPKDAIYALMCRPQRSEWVEQEL